MAGDSYLAFIAGNPVAVQKPSVNSGAPDPGNSGALVALDANGRIPNSISPFTDATNSGTIGAVVINKLAGRCNIAAGQTSVVVTNSLVTTASQVFAAVAQADATALLKNVVPGNGSFTVNLNAAATANTAINFLVVN